MTPAWPTSDVELASALLLLAALDWRVYEKTDTHVGGPLDLGLGISVAEAVAAGRTDSVRMLLSTRTAAEGAPSSTNRDELTRWVNRWRDYRFAQHLVEAACRRSSVDERLERAS